MIALLLIAAEFQTSALLQAVPVFWRMQEGCIVTTYGVANRYTHALPLLYPFRTYDLSHRKRWLKFRTALSIGWLWGRGQSGHSATATRP